MAAGAILPPLFFERRRHASLLAPEWHSQGHPKHAPVSITRLDGRGIETRLPATGHRKDI
jgi:hypothetical protein